MASRPTQARRKAAAKPAASKPRPAASKPVAPKPGPTAPKPEPVAAEPEPVAAPAGRPPALLVSAAAQVLEAVGLAVAAVFAAVSTADGRSYQVGSGIALTLIAVGAAAGVAAIAVGLARVRLWSRTPAVMIQLFVVIGAITLLDGHRPEWGVPALVLAVICVAGLFTPASLRALNRPPRTP